MAAVPPDQEPWARTLEPVVALTAPLPLGPWDELRRQWDDQALADPRFMVVDPAAAEPLGRHLTPHDAVTLWSAAVARTLGIADS